MAQVVFRSKYKAYRIHFDPKRFGQMDSPEGDDYVTDANGNVATVPIDDPQNPGHVIHAPMRRRITKPAAIFQDSMLVLDDAFPMQRTMIEDLRKIVTGKVLVKGGAVIVEKFEAQAAKKVDGGWDTIGTKTMSQQAVI